MLVVRPMRIAVAIVMLAGTGRAQFKSTVPLVVAPTTVTDSKGRYVDGLAAHGERHAQQIAEVKADPRYPKN